jgi:DNA-binding response OmpR family regulator
MARIVICDEDMQVCRFLQATLQRHQFEVEIVHTAQDCLTTCRTAEPHLLVTDLHLPDMDALELLRRMREVLPALPIMAISGDGDEVLQAAWHSGADWVMRKPILPAMLVQTARHLITTHAGLT